MAQDITIRNQSFGAGREIKASLHYSYVQAGLTLDGASFPTGALVLEGQCLIRNTTTKRYEPYKETTPGTFPAGYEHPVVLDESVQFEAKDAADGGGNPNVTVGQVIEHGAVWKGMLINYTDTFAAAVGPRIIFRNN